MPGYEVTMSRSLSKLIYTHTLHTYTRAHTYREQQNRRRLTNRTPAPPAYSLIDTTDFSETETETSMSEPEPMASEPNTPPPPYSP